MSPSERQHTARQNGKSTGLVLVVAIVAARQLLRSVHAYAKRALPTDAEEACMHAASGTPALDPVRRKYA